MVYVKWYTGKTLQ